MVTIHHPLSSPAFPPQKQKNFIILGAGITGLSTALALSIHPHTTFKITIIASHTPGDKSTSYTSPWAGGDWSPQATSAPSDVELREWDTHTYNAWTSLLETDPREGKNLGLGFKEAETWYGEDLDLGELWWKELVKNFVVLDLRKEKRVPVGAVGGVRYRTVCVDVPTHLNYLVKRVQEVGIHVIKADVDVSGGLEGVVKDAKRLFLENRNNVKEDDIFALINCTGLGARKFVGNVEAEKLFSVRGQTILVKGEMSADRTYNEFPSSSETNGEDELVYVIPRPGSGTTILGGCKQKGNWDAEVDEELDQRILERIKRFGLAEELRGKDGKGDFDVISSQVGLRPGRKGGPRVEIDGNGKVDGVWVVHSYGHAGAGYQNSVGSSQKVARLVEELAGIR